MEDNTLDSRIRLLSDKSLKKDADVVVYVMSRDQRLHANDALGAAQSLATELQKPLLIVFNVYPKVGFRAREHFAWMFDGLQQLKEAAKSYNIPVIFTSEADAGAFAGQLQQLHPIALFFDFSPLRGPKRFKKQVVEQMQIAAYEVDAHNVIPAWVVSDKEEFAAHTMRKKITRQLRWYLEQDIASAQKQERTYQPSIGRPLADIAAEVLPKLQSNGTKIDFVSGEVAAQQHFEDFIADGLAPYAVSRNFPHLDGTSDMSPYLHFGQISAHQIAQRLDGIAKQSNSKGLLLSNEALLARVADAAQPTMLESCNVLAEELIVRKEVAENYCFYNENYDNIQGAQDWARKTIAEHSPDIREYVYSYEQLDAAQTHDQSWNAAQMQMKLTGKMQGYMRMYWAKKILEWTPDHETAIAFAVQLNDTYSIDGGDPNGYTGIMWSIAGVHDRAWTERQVFGKIRYMNEAGLRRKFDMDSYIKQWLGTQKLL